MSIQKICVLYLTQMITKAAFFTQQSDHKKIIKCNDERCKLDSSLKNSCTVFYLFIKQTFDWLIDLIYLFIMIISKILDILIYNVFLRPKLDWRGSRCVCGVGDGGGVGVVTWVNMVRMCGSTCQNPPHSYTWALKIGTHSYTYRSKLTPTHRLVWGTG